MAQRLSVRESRRLVRRFLGQDERASRATILFASGAPVTVESTRAEPPPPPSPPPRGPYEHEYPISAGYTTERTIIVP